MIQFKKMCIFLILTCFIFACSSIKQVRRTPPPFKFAGITLSRGIKEKGVTATPVKPTSTFSTEDTEIIAHVKVENLCGKHKIRWDWYDPKGNLYSSSGNFPIKTSQGMYLPEAAAWHILSIQGDKAEDFPGKWEVRVYYDDTLMGSTPFILQDIGQLPEGISQKPCPKDWGLIIGIEDYAHSGAVLYARRDALILREYFVRILGVPKENIISLIDRDATKARIEKSLRQSIRDHVSRDTTLYLYFAGHGVIDTEKGDYYLLPYDGDTKSIAQTGYSLKTFYQDLNDLHIVRVYVFLDSCFSDMASRSTDMFTKTAPMHGEDRRLKRDAIVTLRASAFGQVSNLHQETKNRLFTYFLFRALEGEADENDDHQVSIKEVYEYVKNHVIEASRQKDSEQTPVISPPLDMFKDEAITNRVITRFMR